MPTIPAVLEDVDFMSLQLMGDGLKGGNCTRTLVSFTPQKDFGLSSCPHHNSTRNRAKAPPWFVEMMPSLPDRSQLSGLAH